MCECSRATTPSQHPVPFPRAGAAWPASLWSTAALHVDVTFPGRWVATCPLLLAALQEGPPPAHTPPFLTLVEVAPTAIHLLPTRSLQGVLP